MPTKIEWCDEVWNPVTGCTPISEGCKKCYALRMAKRLAGRCGYPADDPFRVTLHPDRLNEPLKWKKPRRVFVCSMGDLFHENIHPYDIMQIFNVMAKAKHHTFLVLTKRPERMLEFYKRLRPGTTIPGPYFSITGKGEGWAGLPPSLPNNIWIGVTAENQARADERIPILLQIPAAVRFVSVEPMLGPVDLVRSIDVAIEINGEIEVPAVGGIGQWLDWVICGGQTGPGARPMHPDWVRSLRDQCKAAGTALFFKQWGEFAPSPDPELLGAEYWVTYDGNFGKWEDGDPSLPVAACMDRVGKKAAGHLLDGQEWRQFPEGAVQCR